jgi:hypothetical protein
VIRQLIHTSGSLVANTPTSPWTLLIAALNARVPTTDEETAAQAAAILKAVATNRDLMIRAQCVDAWRWNDYTVDPYDGSVSLEFPTGKGFDAPAGSVIEFADVNLDKVVFGAVTTSVYVLGLYQVAG